MPTREEAWRALAASLRAAGIDQAELDARLLVRAASGASELDMIRDPQIEMRPEEAARLDAMTARRLAREPVSRILGTREFWGLTFALGPATLDPRPDSETLVETALRYLPDDGTPARVLDLGTGSGCLLLAILHEREQASGLGIDVAAEAVSVAQENARSLGLGERARFRRGNWATDIEATFDLVISNPPYIRHADIATLAPEVAHHDPVLALDGGDDGLAAYRAIIASLPGLLMPRGHAVFELGQGQAADVGALVNEAGLEVVELAPDLAGIGRVLVAGWPRG
ncbi:MAG: peptide chain release factor N(5)-glutamine methyltransferase [Rhizobiales bacterium]|nr:peptide chain release factor N(5)-glutamine methyltransferase [Hyphomicrobiales bacterium]